MPKPHPYEKKKDYIARCMSDEKAKRERPDNLARLVYCTKIYESEMAAEKVSFDYDETLTTAKGMKLAKEYIKKGADVYIISARSNKDPMLNRAERLGIPVSRIYATGSNKAKIEKVKALGIIKHFDNNADVVKELGKIGVKFSFVVDSYTDYPKQASENAKIALRWAEKHGWGSCGTQVGKIRANQLATNSAISEETIAKMAAFERHRQNSNRPLGDGCGRLMWLAWGGDAGIEWASRKLKQIRNEQ